MARSTFPSRFFSAAEREAILAAVREAESKTSGEIRVHLERRCKGDPQAAAKATFERIGMDRTAEKNGVLFYLAVKDHTFAVIGDSGIDAKVERDFWDRLSERTLAAFREDRFAEGLAAAIRETGEKLAASFPRREGDVNELPDDLSVGS